MARILVIDDEHNIRMMMRLALQHAGHTVETAADGQRGIEMYGVGSDWDLVLLDQRMPGLEGIDVLYQLRYLNPHARIIMATAFGTIDLAVEAMRAGATDFLRKPFTAEVLRGAVQAALKGTAAGGTAAKDVDSGSPGLSFGMTTINGFRIESRRVTTALSGGDFTFNFQVISPAGDTKEAAVLLPSYLVELVKAQSDCEEMPGGARFWQAFSEEALANYLYQNADCPPDGKLLVEEYSSNLKRWVEAVLTGPK